MTAAFRSLMVVITYAVGTAVVVGCAAEEYYCDETGCYYCDGASCRPVDPPHRATCRGDFQCSPKTRCTSLGCVAECEGDANCPKGTVCRTGMCVGPTEPEPTPNPGSCTKTADCDDPCAECRDGVCQRVGESAGSAGCACEDDDTCNGQLVCLGGVCADKESSGCKFNHECGSGRVCIDAQCTASCTTVGSCPVGQECDTNAGVCRDVPPTQGQCTNNTACGANRVCIDSSCYDACSSETCGAGRYCDNGVCRVDNRPRPFCTDDSMCMPNHPCVGGVCRTRCTTPSDCARFDVQFNFCLDGLCVTTNEATSNCERTADCSNNAECIDGVCR